MVHTQGTGLVALGQAPSNLIWAFPSPLPLDPEQNRKLHRLPHRPHSHPRRHEPHRWQRSPHGHRERRARTLELPHARELHSSERVNDELEPGRTLDAGRAQRGGEGLEGTRRGDAAHKSSVISGSDRLPSGADVVGETGSRSCATLPTFSSHASDRDSHHRPHRWGRRVKAFVAVTDGDWFRFLAAQEGLDEVNFWKPSGKSGFQVLTLGEPLLFKLHYPHNFIVGGGFFAHFTRLPVSLAWETFGTKNGAPSYAVMRARIEKYRGISASREDYQIGCILLEDPFFLPRERWIPAPADFRPSTQVGKQYDLTSPAGHDLWERIIGERALAKHAGAERPVEVPGPVYGEGQLARIRLGQGAFRVMVTDAYGRRCSITGEKALPVLQAAHIRPVAEGGAHRLDNGLLLRADVHALFDRGYVSVAPDYRVLVSRKLKEDFDNGEPYYPLRERSLYLPEALEHRPSRELLEWHSDTVFRG